MPWDQRMHQIFVKWSTFWLDSPLKSMRQLLINSRGTHFASKSYRTYHDSKDKWFFILEVLQLSKSFSTKMAVVKAKSMLYL